MSGLTAHFEHDVSHLVRERNSTPPPSWC